MRFDERVHAEVAAHPYPLLFATVSGAHLYGFPSEDSDYDLRGVHILPAREVLGLKAGRETVAIAGRRNGLEIDLVTHDAGKFFTLLLRTNGYVLEQMFSPLVLHTTPEHDELKTVARRCITRHHADHYAGFARTQWRLFEKERPHRVKALLYVYRVLLTGIHLMRTGEVEANLPRLQREYRLPSIPDLIAYKRSGSEQAGIPDLDLAFHRAAYERLRGVLAEAQAASTLPDAPTGREALNDLLVRLRLASLQVDR